MPRTVCDLRPKAGDSPMKTVRTFLYPHFRHAGTYAPSPCGSSPDAGSTCSSAEADSMKKSSFIFPPERKAGERGKGKGERGGGAAQFMKQRRFFYAHPPALHNRPSAGIFNSENFPIIPLYRLSADRDCRGSWLSWRWRCTIREAAPF